MLWMSRFFLLTAAMASFVVITGLTMNFTPSSSVIKVEKLPMVVLCTLLDTQLPTSVKASTVNIITRPLRMSRFLFLP